MIFEHCSHILDDASDGGVDQHVFLEDAPLVREHVADTGDDVGDVDQRIIILQVAVPVLVRDDVGMPKREPRVGQQVCDVVQPAPPEVVDADHRHSVGQQLPGRVRPDHAGNARDEAPVQLITHCVTLLRDPGCWNTKLLIWEFTGTHVNRMRQSITPWKSTQPP